MDKSTQELKEIPHTTRPSAAAVGDSAKAGSRGPGLLIISAVIILNAAVSVLSVYVYDKHYAQKIVAMDLQEYILKVRKQVVDGKFNEEQYKMSIDKMEEAVESVPKNRALITRDVALRNIEIINIPNPLFSSVQTNERVAMLGPGTLSDHKD